MAEVSFGEWLKRRRNAVGLTQEQLASQINCSTSALRKFESEERRPSAEVVEQLADIFNISQEERKSFLRFARGDWQAIPGGHTEEAPRRVSYMHAAPRSNLPASTTSFIGREKEQADIKDLVAKNRLVTLMGAGGIGKTRLSIQTASELLIEFPNGIWLVEFAPLSDPALLPQSIVNTLGLLEQAGRSHLSILSDFLQNKRALLILDNCEHLIQACAQLAETLLHACPDLRILATSREALSIAGETVYLVPSLTTPDPSQSTLDTLSQYEAVRLFLERAKAAMPNFSMTRDNVPAIVQVCHHLDGIPLALELAAARVRGLSVDQIASRLDDRFHLLTGGTRTVLPRHQTLQALIDWSHDLLTEPERILFRRLSIFTGGWTLEAAETVCAGNGLESNQILDLLLRLVDKSLVTAETQKDEARYHMLETIRQYAREKLWAAGEGEILRQQHLAYFFDLAERAEPHLRAFGMIEWLDQLEAEHDNLRAALEWAQESDVEAQLRLASALLWFWHIRGRRNEGVDWLERALSIEAMDRGDQPLTPDRALIRGKALNASGFLFDMAMDRGKAQTRLEESLRLFEELGPAGKQGMAYALMRLGNASALISSPRGMLEQSLIVFREVGDKFGVAECLMLLTGYPEKGDDNYKLAETFVEEELALRREIGDQDGIASALTNLGRVAFWQDDYQKAITLYEESLALFREVGNKWAISYFLLGYGNVCFWQGDYDRATKIFEEALSRAQELGHKYYGAVNIYSLGTIAGFRGDYARATQMIKDSLAVFRDTGYEWFTAGSLHALGNIALAQSDDKSAVGWYEEELAFSQEKQFTPGRIFASVGLGKVAWIKGDYELATKRFEEVLRMCQEADEKQAAFHAFYGLGRVAQSQRDYETARAYYAEMLEMQRLRIKVPFNSFSLKTYVCAIAYPLEGFAVLAIAHNKMERGARLLSAAETQYLPLCFEMSAKERAEHDQAIAAARAALGEEAFAAAWEEGENMTLEETFKYALNDREANIG